MGINSQTQNEGVPLSKEQKEDLLYAINNRFGGIPNEHYDKSEVWMWITTGQQKIRDQIGNGYKIFHTGLHGKRLELINLYTKTLKILYRGYDVEDQVAHDFRIDKSLINPSKGLHQEDNYRVAMEEMGAKLGPDMDERPTWEEFGAFISSEVLQLVDAKTRLEKSEVVEFKTPEEIFFFILNLLGLEKLAAYLNGEGKRKVNFPLKRGEHESIIQIINHISRNHEPSDIKMVLYEMGIPIEVPPDSILSLSYLCNDTGINIQDLDKIRLK